MTEESKEPEVRPSEPQSSTDQARFKLEINKKKYPVEKAKGSAEKYTKY
jgi:hypothetical protein